MVCLWFWKIVKKSELTEDRVAAGVGHHCLGHVGQTEGQPLLSLQNLKWSHPRMGITNGQGGKENCEITWFLVFSFDNWRAKQIAKETWPQLQHCQKNEEKTNNTVQSRKKNKRKNILYVFLVLPVWDFMCGFYFTRKICLYFSNTMCFILRAKSPELKKIPNISIFFHDDHYK